MNCLIRTAAFLLAVVAFLGQDVRSASLQGSVRDAQGRSVTAARVQLKTGGETFSVETDADGRYRFLNLRPGTYSLHAEAPAGQAEFGPFVLGQQEARAVDLKLGSASPPQYFDTPSFVVAGVTDSANRGGHGSDPIGHSTYALVKATALLGIAEKQGDDLETIRAVQHAAELDPSESHLFTWGAELLTHRAAEQAGEVFSRGNRLFPRSTRMWLGLAVACFSRGSYDQAQRFFFAAADLDPADPTPYLFLGQVRNSSIGQSDGFIERMARFARLQPENAWANFYYAASLGQRVTGSEAQALLEKAVRLDPRLGAAWLQLGILFAEKNNFSNAISAWQRAITAGGTTPDATVIEAHYRLAQAYRKTGQPEKAKAEIEIHTQLAKQSALEEERERAAIREFVFTLRDQTSTHQ